MVVLTADPHPGRMLIRSRGFFIPFRKVLKLQSSERFVDLGLQLMVIRCRAP
jgi:hypothetical protein